MSVISVDKASKGFGLKKLFTGVTFTIGDGEVVALVGNNGCGKTTLIRCMVGLDEFDDGRVRVPKNCRVGYLSQEFDQIGRTCAYEETVRGLDHVLSLEREVKALELRMSDRAALSDDSQLQALLRRYERAARAFETEDGYNLTTYGTRSHESVVRATSKLDADDLEAEIIALEQKAKALEELFADSDFYSASDCYQKLREHEQLTERLRVLYDAWEGR